MNKAELIEAIADRIGEKKTAAAAVEAVVDTITRTVAKGEKVAITGFGVFEKQNRPARKVRNPATGATMMKKKTSTPKFRAGAGFKDAVSGAKKLPALPSKAAAKKTAAKKATAKKTASASTGTTRGAAKKATTIGRKTTTKRAPAAKKTTARGTAKSASTRGAAKKSTAKKSTTKRTARKRG